MIKLYNYSKLLLTKSYEDCLNLNISNNKKEYLKAKFKHSQETLNIACKIYNIRKEEGFLYLLHDIGRFRVVIDHVEKEDHAYYGYKYLYNKHLFDEEVLLPIMLHETDIGWEENLNALKLFQNLNKDEKDRVITNIKKLKDADILANMIVKLKNTKIEGGLNSDIYNCLLNGKICEKDYVGAINRAIYIISGVYILSTPEGLSFVKESGLIKKYLDKVIKKSGKGNLKDKLLKCKECLIEKGYI